MSSIKLNKNDILNLKKNKKKIRKTSKNESKANHSLNYLWLRLLDQ